MYIFILLPLQTRGESHTFPGPLPPPQFSRVELIKFLILLLPALQNSSASVFAPIKTLPHKSNRFHMLDLNTHGPK